MNISDIIIIIQFIFSIKEKIKQSPLQESIKRDCEEIIDERYAQQSLRLSNIQENFSSENNLPTDFWNCLDINLGGTLDNNPHINQGSSQILLKTKGFFQLYNNQIAQYDQGITLHHQLINEKDALIKQIQKDAPEIMKIFLLQSQEILAQTPGDITLQQSQHESIINEINSSNKFLDQLIQESIQSFDDLLSQLITRVSG